MKQQLLALFLILLCSVTYSQVGIGTTSPDPSSILDIQSTTKGILTPRINLNSVSNSTIDGTNTNASGLLIYNTNASVTGGNGVGYYYWDGSIWVSMNATPSDQEWKLDGNSVSSGDFLGTTNAQNLRIRTNNTERFNFSTDGQLLFTNGGIEVGTGTTAASSNIAVGNNSTASATNGFATAVGEGSVAGGTASSSYGTGASATGSNATAVGNNAQANNFPSSAFGYDSQANAYQATAIGGQTRANFNGATALGVGAQSNQENALSIGTGSKAQGFRGVAIGNLSNAVEDDVVAIGSSATANTVNGIAIGANASTTGVDAIAIGANSKTTAEYGLAFGREATSAARGLALGFKAKAQALNTVAIGQEAIATQPNTIILGNSSTTTPNVNVGIGTSTPDTKLHVAGSVKIVDGTQGAGRILTSDANGVGSWVIPNNQVYGEGYRNSNLNIDNAGTYTVDFNTSNLASNVTFNNTDNYLEITTSGVYEVSYALSFQKNSASDRAIDAYVRIGTTPINKSYMYAGNTDNVRFAMSKTFIVSLAATNRLYLSFISDGDDLTLQRGAYLMVRKIN